MNDAAQALTQILDAYKGNDTNIALNRPKAKTQQVEYVAKGQSLIDINDYVKWLNETFHGTSSVKAEPVPKYTREIEDIKYTTLDQAVKKELLRKPRPNPVAERVVKLNADYFFENYRQDIEELIEYEQNIHPTGWLNETYKKISAILGYFLENPSDDKKIHGLMDSARTKNSSELEILVDNQ